MPNRLVDTTSPYLRQHADNPVDWYPWGNEPFEVAKRLDRPVFLSVGYSSCHWCHVMAHESFEDDEVGKFLNENFVCVKVDREERPDVDEAYMTAVQLMSGRGGWPMSAFLTADRKPFFAGTYWPKEDRGDHPGFLNICHQIVEAWHTKRDMVKNSAEEIASALTEALSSKTPTPTGELSNDLMDRAVETILGDFDPTNGGFGHAPKFPPHTAIDFLLRYALGPSADNELQEAAISASFLTLRSMIFGGIHDHVGGGFHRYSTDEVWLVPHFEKMLYDNALMLGNLAAAAGIATQIEPTLAEVFAGAAKGIIEWLMREMASEEGYFFSAIDADSEGEEGKFYTWTSQEITDLLQHHAPVFLQSYGCAENGNFEDEATHRQSGVNILHLTSDLSGQFEQELEMLRLAREERVRPGLDNKGIVAWNGMAIGALASSGMWPLAQNAIVAILAAEKANGGLPHQIVEGVPSGTAFLDDYAFFVQSLLRLSAAIGFLEEEGQAPAQAIPSSALFKEAKRIADTMVELFYDEDAGGFFGTSNAHESLFGRTKPIFDQPTPSANAVAIECLIELGEEARARQSLEALLGWMEKAPHSTEALFATALTFLLPTELNPEDAVTDGAVSEPIASPQNKVEVRISSRELRADENGAGVATVSIVVPEGMHLNSSNPPARWLIPTKLEIRGLEGKVDYPAGENDRYLGTVTIPFTVRLPDGVKGAEFEVQLSFQAYTESECQEPEERRFTVVIVR